MSVPEFFHQYLTVADTAEEVGDVRVIRLGGRARWTVRGAGDGYELFDVSTGMSLRVPHPGRVDQEPLARLGTLGRPAEVCASDDGGTAVWEIGGRTLLTATYQRRGNELKELLVFDAVTGATLRIPYPSNLHGEPALQHTVDLVRAAAHLG